MKKFSFNSIIRKQQPKVIFIETIWKSWHRHLSISIVIGNDIAKKLFLRTDFVFKKKQNIYILSCAQLWYQYYFATNTQFSTISYSSSQRRPLAFQTKSYFNIWKHPFWCFKKITAPKMSAYFESFPVKHPRLSFFLSTLVGLPRIT